MPICWASEEMKYMKNKKKTKINLENVLIAAIGVTCVLLMVSFVREAKKDDTPKDGTPAEPTSVALTVEKSGDPASHVYSHRGASGEEEEHSFAAYDLAILYGSRYIEQDVVLSSQGTLYVSHDLSALRMTEQDVLFSEMKDADIDALHTTGGHPILRLSDVFDRYGTSVNYVIELKDEEAVDPFVKLVKKYKMQDNIIVQCFYIRALRKLEKTFPDMPKLYLVSSQEILDKSLSYDCVDIVSVGKNLMTAENREAVRGAGKTFSAWTLDSADEIQAAIDLGVDCYFTNYTAKALALENEYRGQ